MYVLCHLVILKVSENIHNDWFVNVPRIFKITWKRRDATTIGEEVMLQHTNIFPKTGEAILIGIELCA